MGHLTVLTGGDGGLRFVAGLVGIRAEEEEIHIIANVGSDCELWGLYCCPDIDGILHVLAGQHDPYEKVHANGRSFECFETIRKLGMPSWMRICDRDLATHLVRSALLRSGASLDEATRQLADRFGLGVRLMPASNDPVRTTVHTAGGPIGAGEYAGRPDSVAATGVTYEGADRARPADAVIRSILEADRIILAPGDPVLGIGAILAVRDIRNALARTRGGVVAISPMIGSQPLWGYLEPGHEEGLGSGSGFGPDSVVAFAQSLLGAVDGIVIHTSDVQMLDAIRETGVDAWPDNILIRNLEEARRLAGRITSPERPVGRKR